jgi:hypothetical protein
MKNILIILIVALSMLSICSCNSKDGEYNTISTELLKDKIAGGWAGKMIGVTYGDPTAFEAQGRIYDEPINWVPADIIGSLHQDDIYVQLTFMMAMDQFGLDAPAKKFQELLAVAGYPLWYANVQSRKNFFDSIFPPQSGNPEFNIHADDIDFQIESDFIGFMCPGMPQAALQMADKVGHVMNYGDGVYGGIFVSALHSAAFFDDNIPSVVNKALLSVPAESDYARAIGDVIKLHKQYPDDWRLTWEKLQDKWGEVDITGAGSPFNIDAKINGAYIATGLLYGNGDFMKTLEITTRCGQDSDCNPSNAMAVLGIIRGLSGIDEEYKEIILGIEDSLFINTNYSFRKAVDNTLSYSEDICIINGGEVKGPNLKIKVQQVQPPELEVSFPKLVYDHREMVFEKGGWQFKGQWETYKMIQRHSTEQEYYGDSKYSSNAGDEAILTFKGTGVSIIGNWHKNCGKADVYVDGELIRTIDTYYFSGNQQHDNKSIYHISGLEQGSHTLKLVVRGEKRAESEGSNIYLSEAVIFKNGDKESDNYEF